MRPAAALLASLLLLPACGSDTTAPASGPVVAPEIERQAGTVRLSVDAGRTTRSISEEIYGLNFAPRALASALDLPVDRWGGDSTETYNWKIHAANQGVNYYFTNFSDCWSARFDYCTSGRDFSGVDEQIEQDRQIGSRTLLTLPTMGWVAKDGSLDGPGSCSYPTSTYPRQDDVDPYNPDCGNGVVGGRVVTSPPVDPRNAGLAVGATFNRQWVQSLVSTYGDAAHGGVGIYALGNEPGLWADTHRSFQQQPLGFDDLWQRASAVAQAVKSADPTADVLGPSEWGWISYFCSGQDNPFERACTPQSPDRADHGGTDLASWYLQQFAALEQRTGVRHLDYFDWHYYPQASGDAYAPATNVTRPLWDPSYVDPSYIEERIQLIPRMRRLVEDNYPGTKLAVTEYNLGLDVTSDRRLQNVIQADTLGIFGREGLDLATYWPEDRSPVPEQAFRMYRNYDGQGARFGDLGVAATSSDQGRVAVYAARAGATGPLTVLIVNKGAGAVSAPLTLRGFPHAPAARVYQYAGKGIVRRPDATVSKTGFTLSYPGRSITLVAVRGR
ncbi:MAG: endoglucanase [Actinobacteria bacterium]|uniref:Unannotated protein n=1 Tax=freshwater metagenome TaxID=449393 RepID=A0A6J6R988_9ZZZZ|nr:endoglucanase [Actinomycetota bacterium]